jgi:hypothetical protein
MKISLPAIVAALGAGVAMASVEAARDQDMELRMKWALAEDVHYDVVAEYSAPTEILGPVNESQGRWSGASKAPVADRFEISFDMSPMTRTPIGKVAFKNYPSVVGPGLFAGACQQPPPLKGSYEHLEVVEATVEGTDVVLTTTRTFPEGSVPITNETVPCALHVAPATTRTLTHRVVVIPGTFLATPALAPTNIATVGEENSSAPNKVIVAGDGKTMVLDNSARGWKYTYTLRIVK